MKIYHIKIQHNLMNAQLFYPQGSREHFVCHSNKHTRICMLLADVYLCSYCALYKMLFRMYIRRYLCICRYQNVRNSGVFYDKGSAGGRVVTINDYSALMYHRLIFPRVSRDARRTTSTTTVQQYSFNTQNTPSFAAK